MNVLPAYIYVHYMSALYLWNPEEDVGSHGMGVIGSYELPFGIWEPNLGPLQEYQVL